MCGIAGCVGRFVEGLAHQMNRAQAHRGPDGAGVFENSQSAIALGHVRLAILDTSERASQPMISADGRFVLAYNGEIYNYLELRQELESSGEVFRSTGDTEVLLRGLSREGIRFLSRLNGMFAFAFWDKKEGRLLLARDPLGIKPLYIAEPNQGVLLFASEIKALLVDPSLPRTPDFRSLLEHITFGHAIGERTAFKAIRRMTPGTWLEWEGGTIRTCRYWNRREMAEMPLNRKQATEELRGLLSRAIHRQLISDVPVGSFFSGGLDSTLVTATAVRAQSDSNFRCYTISYPESQNHIDQIDSDGPYAQRFARDLGFSLTSVEMQPKEVSLLPKLIYHLDEPVVDPAVLSSYLICRQARQDGRAVLLSGQGADELFGGYPWYSAMALSASLDILPRSMRECIANVSRGLPGSRGGRSGVFLRRLRRLLSYVGDPPDRRFLSYCAIASMEDIKSILGPAFEDTLREGDAFKTDLELMQAAGLNGSHRWLERELYEELPNLNLLYTDKTSMAVGLEARVPLLDLELVKAVAPFPSSWKYSRTDTKILLREAASSIVPEGVRKRRKAGFGAPYRTWLKTELNGLSQEISESKQTRERGWFDTAAIRRTRGISRRGKRDLYMIEWAVLTVELWARAFLDKTASS